LLIIGLLSLLTFWIVRQGDDFAGGIFLFLTIAIAGATGALFLILRVLKFLKSPTNFLYNYFATLNLSLAFFHVLVISLKELSFNQVILISLNLLLGLTMLFDIYRKRRFHGKPPLTKSAAAQLSFKSQLW